jgi:hypothetical protein
MYTYLIGPKIEPAVDVMITIFCDFRRFSAKILAFFLKTNVTRMQILQKALD